LVVNDSAAADKINREEEIVGEAIGARNCLLAQAGKRTREDTGSGQEPLGDPHTYRMVRKRLQREQPAFAQLADRNGARAGGQIVGGKAKRCDRRRGARHGF
jgi:hypothetical protein